MVKTLIMGIDWPGYASIMVTILFFSGVQLITLGVIGEYLGRMFNETKRRPLYLVQELIGINPMRDAALNDSAVPGQSPN